MARWQAILVSGRILLLLILMLHSPLVRAANEPDPLSAETTSPNSNTYESLQPAHAVDVLPPDLIKGEHHQVLDEITPDDWWYRYTIESPFGSFEALGEDMLRIRTHELQALAQLEEETSQPKAFGYGVLDTVMSPFKFVWDLATEPKDTITGIPKGIGRMGSRIGEMLTGKRGKLEDGEGQELMGYAAVKRGVAALAGVNVYSSNPVLQEKLDSLAAAGYSGGVGSRIALIPVSGPIGFALTTTSFSSAMNQMLQEHAPEDLRQLNRDTITRMGIRSSVRETFLEHPWYSPRHETILVHALEELKGVSDRSLFLQTANKAANEEEALFFQRLAEMFASYHQTVVPLYEFIAVDDRLLVGYSTDKALVAAIPLPHLPWTEEVAQATDRLVAWESRAHPIRRVELWITGKLTARAHQELQDRGIMIFEQTRDRLMPPLIPEKAPLAKEAGKSNQEKNESQGE